MADAEYVDPKTLGLPTGTEDQAWLAAQVERIDPWHMEQGHDGAYTRALEKLALELREQAKATEKPVAYWIPKAEQFCIAHPSGRPFASAWQPLYSGPIKPTTQQAHDMGAKGATPTEAERLLFEAWMAGHCWQVSGDWNGATYIHKLEKGNGNLHGPTVFTRGLWAAWRDRAALAQKGGVA